jgi:transcription initiation factor TFIIF subunit alpha
MAKHQKNKDPERWLLHNRNGKAPSAATSAIFKAESEGRVISGSSSLVHTAGQSLGPGGRKLKTVDSGMDGLFGEDDEDGNSKRKREKEYGGEGDLDEQVYEEDFADDEEKMDDENEDEETKELEVYFLYASFPSQSQPLFRGRNDSSGNTKMLINNGRVGLMNLTTKTTTVD